MPAPKTPSKPVYSIVPLTYQGKPLEIGTELQDLLEPAQLDALLDADEASYTKPKSSE